MKIFISWSGERSRHVADGLRNWLPYIFQSIKPWISGKDIEAGARWSKELWSELEATSFGILCVTPENVTAPWLLFEAGALAKVVDDARVIPLLIDLEPVDIPSGPLTQFQAKKANRHGILDIIQTINKSLEQSLTPDRLSETFERWWPDLQQVLESLPPPKEASARKRDVESMIEEILVAVRGLERASKQNPSPESLATRVMIPGSHIDFRVGNHAMSDEVTKFVDWGNDQAGIGDMFKLAFGNETLIRIFATDFIPVEDIRMQMKKLDLEVLESTYLS